MPFRKLCFVGNTGAFYTPFLPSVDVVDDKVVEHPLDVHAPLPDVSDFDLKNQLEAGIPIKEVSTKILTPSFSSVVGLLDSVKADEPSSEAGEAGKSDE